MTAVVDSHVHVFPYLGGASGFASEAEHRQFLQLYMATHGEPVRRLSDHTTVLEQTLHGPQTPDVPASLARRAARLTVVADEAALGPDPG